jgi:hypothetical protein
MPLIDITIDQLRDTTKEHLIDLITERLKKMEKKELYNWLWTIKDIETQDHTFETIASAKDGENGQIERVTTLEDIIGDKIGEKIALWTYYQTGPVDEILLSETDQNDKVTQEKTIKHFLNGNEPILISKE